MILRSLRYLIAKCEDHGRYVRYSLVDGYQVHVDDNSPCDGIIAG